jgi:5'-3' exonuclease
MGDLSFEDKKTGIIFGYFIQLLKLAKDHGTSNIVHVWDSNSSKRLKIYPQYKEKRRSTKAEKTELEKLEDAAAYAQFDLLYNEILPELGYLNNFKVEGLEGDDLVAAIIYDNPHDFLIASGDEDLLQCIGDGVSIIKKKGLYTEKDFIDEYGIHPTQWAEVKAIAGCSTDEVPGIKGVGEKTAIQHLLGNLTPNLKSYQNIVCQAGKEIIARNRKLVTLPFAGTPHIEIVEDENLSLDAFMQLCQRFGFEYFLKPNTLKDFKTYLNFK